MKRFLAVPDLCRSAHGVFTADPLPGAADFPAPGPSLLRRFGASEAQLARLAARPHARVLLTESAPAQAAQSAHAARAEALALAEEHDGVVVDLGVPRVVEALAPGAQVSAAAGGWVAVDVEPAGLTGRSLTTRGLDTFGLPELRLGEVPPEAAAPAIAVLLGLSQRLLDEWPQRDPVGPATITLDDIAAAYDDDGLSGPAGRSTDVMIALDAGELHVTLLGDPATDLFS